MSLSKLIALEIVLGFWMANYHRMLGLTLEMKQLRITLGEKPKIRLHNFSKLA